MNDKKLDINKLIISKSELLDLYKISSCAVDIAAHDFASSVSFIGANSEIAVEYLNRIKKQEPLAFSTSDENKLVDQLTSFLYRAKETSREIIKLFEIFFRQYRHYEIENMFVAKPLKIIDQLRDIHQETEINLDKASLRSIEIIFPENILFGILSELIRNANKAVDADCKVLIRWFVSDRNFVIEVHDNGPGIIEDLNYNFLPVDVLGLKLSGLDIINKIKSYIKGNLFFSKSMKLGGTCVYIDFPIIAYYKQGKVHELR